LHGEWEKRQADREAREAEEKREEEAKAPKRKYG
jgi:hypothetical protein